jgi:hypothetical protein
MVREQRHQTMVGIDGRHLFRQPKAMDWTTGLEDVVCSLRGLAEDRQTGKHDRS